MHLALSRLEIHAVIRDDPGESLGDPAEADGDSRHEVRAGETTVSPAP
jgi:hypothetical protein